MKALNFLAFERCTRGATGVVVEESDSLGLSTAKLVVDAVNVNHKGFLKQDFCCCLSVLDTGVQTSSNVAYCWS